MTAPQIYPSEEPENSIDSVSLPIPNESNGELKPAEESTIDENHECDEECDRKYPIHCAAKNGNFDIIKSLVLNGNWNLTRIDCCGFTIMHHITSEERSGNLEVAQLLLQQINKDVIDKEFLDIKCPDGNTALANAAETYQPDLVELLLSYGANPSIIGDCNALPINKAAMGGSIEAIRCVEMLFDQEESKHLEQRLKNKIMDDAVLMGNNPEMIELLINKGFKYSGICEDSDATLVGLNILQKSVVWTSDDSAVDIKSFEKLLSYCDYDDINIRATSDDYKEKSALHLAADGWSPNLMSVLLKNDHINIYSVDGTNRTVLHLLADLGWSYKVGKTIKTILGCDKMSKNEDKKKLLDMKDSMEETALEIAIRRDSIFLSQILLLAYPDPPEEWIQMELLRKIYGKVPEIMLPLMDSAIVFENKNYEAGDETFEAQIGPIIGYDLNRDALNDLSWYGKSSELFQRETSLLAIILDSEYVKTEEQDKMLNHPLVELFIQEKWRKLNWLFWFSFCLHITWLILYTLFVVEVYWIDCAYPITNQTGVLKKVSQSNENESDVQSTNNTHPEVTDDSQQEFSCKLDLWEKVFGYLLVASLSLLWIMKIFTQICTVGIRKIFNLEDITLSIFTPGVISTIVTTCVLGASYWHYWVTSINMLLASFMALGHIRKIPALGIYADVFYRALNKLIWLMAAFFPLLLGFTIAISILLPGNDKFPSILFNIIKILMMMTGEINYDDVFSTEYKTPFRDYAVLLFAFFAIMVSIVMFNLLLGFTISDIQALESESEMKMLYCALEQTILLEWLILSRLVQRIIPASYLEKYMIDTKKFLNYGSDLQITMDSMPTKIRIKIRDMAIKRVAK